MPIAFRLEEIAMYWRVPQSTVQKWIASGELGYFRIARTVRIPYEEMLKFRERHPEYAEIEPKEYPTKKIRPAQPSRLYGENAASVIDTLIDSMGQPTQKFSSEELKSLRNPSVYAWVRNGRILYIGKSKNGFLRPIDPNHHRLNAFRDGDELLIWNVSTDKAAERVEANLIRRLKPFYNTKAPELIHEQEIIER